MNKICAIQICTVFEYYVRPELYSPGLLPLSIRGSSYYSQDDVKIPVSQDSNGLLIGNLMTFFKKFIYSKSQFFHNQIKSTKEHYRIAPLPRLD